MFRPESTFGVPARPSMPEQLSRRRALALFGAAFEPQPSAIRFALSETLVHGVNLADARATMSIWMRRISQDIKVEILFDPQVFDSTAQLHRKIREGAVDAVALNALEYRMVAQYLDPAEIATEVDGAGFRYLLLVPTASAAQQARDLRGKSITLLEGRTACLIPHWLRTLLPPEPPERFFSAVTTEFKASQVVLPVFFNRSDACVTTLRAYQTLCELNPQIAKRLRILERSPELVASFYIFRRGFQGALRDRLAAALASLKNNPSGRQLMTLFQFNDMQLRPLDCLKETLRLIETAERLRPGK